MNCPRCQATVTAQDKYCPTCGLALEAAKKGATKRPPKRDYEEASTQLVDVDEFRKYMANEGSEAGAGPADGSRTGRPDGGSKKSSSVPVERPPLPPDVKTPDSVAAAAKRPAAQSGKKGGDDLPQLKKPIGPRIILAVLGVGVLVLIAYMLYGALAG